MTYMITEEQLIKQIKGQTRSADMWIQQYERYKDIPSIRQAAFAIGKIGGMMMVLQSMYGMDKDMPEELIELRTKYQTVWENLEVPEKA